jgi:hypothetical protein
MRWIHKARNERLRVLAVAIRVLHRLFHRLLGDADGVLAAAVEAFRGFQDLLVLGVRGDASLYACHVRSAVLADVLAVVADQTVTLAGDAGFQQARGRDLEALLGARFRLQLRHFASELSPRPLG